jgi:hypothetical protein
MHELFSDSVLSMPGVAFVAVPMLLVTIVVRAVVAGIARLTSGSWLERYDLIVIGHVLSLLLSSFLATLVEVAAVGLAPFPTFGSALLRSIELYWPIQAILLILDLGFHLCAKLVPVKRFD